MPILSWSARVFGSIETEMTGSGKVIVLEHDRVIGITERIAGEGVLESDDGADVSGVDGVNLFPVVRVHLQQPADALALALGRVQRVGAR